MKPSFALDLAADGVRLLHRTALGWRCVGEASLDSPDLAQQIAALRSTALGLSPEGLTTRLVIPNSQVLYRKVHAPGPDATLRRRQIRAALEGMTPYPPEDLAYDWTGDGDEVQVALVARETLEEAEAFAADSRFTPVAFVAIPEPGQFDGEPFFGQTHLATAMLPQGERVEREAGPMRLIDPPKAAAKRPQSAPGQTPQAPVEGPDTPTEAPPPAPDLPTPGPDELPEQPQEQPPAIPPDLPGPPPHEIPGQPPEERPVGVLSGHVEEGHDAQPPEVPPQEDDPLDADVRGLATPRKQAPQAEIRPTPSVQTPSVPPRDDQAPPRAHSALARLGLRGADDIAPEVASGQTLDPVRTSPRKASMRTGLLLTAGLLIVIVLLLLGSGLFLSTQETGRADDPVTAKPTTVALAALSPLVGPAAAETASLTPPVAATDAPQEAIRVAPPRAEASPATIRQRTFEPAAAAQPEEALSDLKEALGGRFVTLDTIVTGDHTTLAMVEGATAPRASAPARARPGSEAPLTGAAPSPGAGTGVAAAPPRPRSAGPAAATLPYISPSSDPKAKLSVRRAESRPTAVYERARALAEAENPPVATTLDRPQPRPKNFAPSVTAALAVAQASAPAPTPAAAPVIPSPVTRSVVAARPTVENARTTARVEVDVEDEPEPKAVAPRIPTSASVAKQATLTRAMNLRDVNLIGVYGTASNRRALVRLPSGRVQQVKVGDRLDGGQVAAIGANQLHYVKSGRSIVLALPKT